MCAALCEPHSPPQGWMAARQSRGSAQVCSGVPAVLVCLPQSPGQPPGCQPAASGLGPAPCGRRALHPTAPGSHLGCKLSTTTLLGGEFCLFWEWDRAARPGVVIAALWVPRRVIPLHHPMGWGPRHGLWGPDVALCDVGIPTSEPTVTAAPPAPHYTLTQLPPAPCYTAGLSPLNPGSPRAPVGTCPGGKARGRCPDPGASRSREAPSRPSCTPRVCLSVRGEGKGGWFGSQ